MRYIYFNYGLMTITILPHESTEHGEKIGTSEIWPEVLPRTKLFILSTLMQRTEYKDITTGLVIDDCDVPKPTPPPEETEQEAS